MFGALAKTCKKLKTHWSMPICSRKNELEKRGRAARRLEDQKGAVPAIKVVNEGRSSWWHSHEDEVVEKLSSAEIQDSSDEGNSL